MSTGTQNKFCRLDTLSNESSVEQFFVSRLLADLGYEDKQIKPKTSLQELNVNLGRRKVKYKPDYALEIGTHIRWIVEAKSVIESLDDFIGQCSGYCLNLNRGYPDSNPVQFFMLTNGITTRVYEWDKEQIILELDFADFQDDNVKYKRLKDILRPETFRNQPETPVVKPKVHTLVRKNISQVNADFAWCHQFIYRKDNISQSAAFMEFIKIVFLKLLSDREIHKKYPHFARQQEVTVPTDEVRFSVRWLAEREKDHPNPLDALQFQNMLHGLEAEIQRGKRKRIFNLNDHIVLSPDTIKGVVARLESTDLFGIDTDLNGRLFETFLNATMRGKDLGQYFTPRSIVKLATSLARLQVSREHTDTVIDACCGTGGFLIEAFSVMVKQVDANYSFSGAEKEHFKHLIATERVYGVDVAADPNLARIARMNMYLHGDGGSSIFQVDILDKHIEDQPTDSPELQREKSELRKKLQNGNFADVVLTNPPFAKEYERKYDRERKILDEYKLAFDVRGGKRAPRNGLRSSIMFLERYLELLKPGGRFITVIDDSILGGVKYRAVREYIRANFIVRAVVSLPGDAFQRSKARVKTSLLYLEKKKASSEEQPPVFMYYCTVVGIDDPARQRVLPIDETNRIAANKEIEDVAQAFSEYLRGDPSARKWVVPATFIADRLDVKSCLPKPNRNVDAWKNAGVKVIPLSEMVETVYLRAKEEENEDESSHRMEGLSEILQDKDLLEEVANDDIIDTAFSDELVTHLRVRYDGFAEADKQIYAVDSTYSQLYRVHTGDIVISNINAVHGAIAIVPEHLDGFVVTTEYTVCRAKAGYDPRLVWMLLRTPEARSNLILLATGIGRNRVNWNALSALQLPLPDEDAVQYAIEQVKYAEEIEKRAQELRKDALQGIEMQLSLDNKEARAILEAFKPPR